MTVAPAAAAPPRSRSSDDGTCRSTVSFFGFLSFSSSGLASATDATAINARDRASARSIGDLPDCCVLLADAQLAVAQCNLWSQRRHGGALTINGERGARPSTPKDGS